MQFPAAQGLTCEKDPTTKYFLAIDLGTSAVKTALFDEKGTRVALAIEEYQLLTPEEDMCEVAALTFWDNFLAGFKKVMAESQVMPIGLCFPELPDNTSAGPREVPDSRLEDARNPAPGSSSTAPSESLCPGCAG